MSEPASTSGGDEHAGPSPLRLRIGVLFILLWWFPFWALAPTITKSLAGLPHPPSVAVVTTAIVVVQTLIGLLGFFVAGTEVKRIVKETPRKRDALKTIWVIFLHGHVPDHEPAVTPPSPAQPGATPPTAAEPAPPPPQEPA
jgi:hypothetical protein